MIGALYIAASFVLSLFLKELKLAFGTSEIGAEVPTPGLLVSDVILIGLKLTILFDFLLKIEAPRLFMPIFLIFFFFNICGISIN